MSQKQLTLPYEPISKVANRNYLRENFKRNSLDSYYIQLNKIKERDGLNSRFVYEDILELADAIISNPETIDPMVLDITPEGVGLVDEGHRRLRAHLLNVERGKYKDDILIEFFPNKSDVTELDRMVRQVTSNLNLKKDLKPYEKAKVAWNVKNLYSIKPKSHEEVGKLLHLSRQTIDNLIRIHEAPDNLRKEMISADMSMSECLALVVGADKLKKEADKAELDASKTSSSPLSNKPDPLAGELKELKELEETTDEELQQREMQRIAKEEKEREAIIAISDEIKVRPETLPEHLGRKLSMPVYRVWVEDFVDEDNGEVVSVERSEMVINENEIITDEVVATILELSSPVDTIFVYQKGKEPVAKSVITVQAGEEDDSVKYDMDRIEMQQVQNVIKNFDKMVSIVSRIDCCPEQTKTDLEKLAEWTQRDLAELRTWVHKNKRQNKSR